MGMDCYVVRIYRQRFHGEAKRCTEGHETLIGVVENAAGTQRRKFQNIDELRAILSGYSVAEMGGKQRR